MAQASDRPRHGFTRRGAMKLGMHMGLWTARPVADEHGWVLDRLKALGYDAAELHVAEMTDDEADAWVKAAGDVGMELVASLVMRPGREDPASEDAALREAAAAAMGRAAEKAARFGSGVLVGPMFQAPGRFTGEAPTATEIECVADVLRKGGEAAGRLGVRMAIEPLNRFESYVANTLGQAAAIVDRVGLTNVGLLADTHHANIEEKDPAGAFTACVDRIGYVHISENDRGVPGEGHAAPLSVFAALRGAGYDGYVTVEAFTTKHPVLVKRLRLWRDMCGCGEFELARRAAAYIRGCWEGKKP